MSDYEQREEQREKEFIEFRAAFCESRGISPAELRQRLTDQDSALAKEWRRAFKQNTSQWCGDCKTEHKPTAEHPVCELCSFGIHAPRPEGIYFDYRGWKFTPPFICMGCGIEICFRQWAFARSCGACDVSESMTRRLLYMKCFAGPREKLPTWNAANGDIAEDHFVDPAEREEYPVMRRRRKLEPMPRRTTTPNRRPRPRA